MRKATKRVDVLVTAAEKTRVTEAVRTVGISTGAYMRGAAAAYRLPKKKAMIDEMLRGLAESTRGASTAVDSVLAWIAASNRRIAEMERASSCS
jgi:hypothetical protein